MKRFARDCTDGVVPSTGSIKTSQTMNKLSTEYRGGVGDSQARGDDVEPILRAARRQSGGLMGASLPWLCWNVHSDWCLLRPRLAKTAGWTPLMDIDPRAEVSDHIVPRALEVDFNADLRLLALYPHLRLEFAFSFLERITLWASDQTWLEPKMR